MMEENIKTFVDNNWFQIMMLLMLYSISGALSKIADKLSLIEFYFRMDRQKIKSDYHSDLWAINASIKKLKEKE